jgi:hypothetical protein
VTSSPVLASIAATELPPLIISATCSSVTYALRVLSYNRLFAYFFNMILSGIAYPFKVMSIHKGKCIINGGLHLVTAQQKNKLNLWMEQSGKTLKLIYYNNNNIIFKIITVSANPSKPHIFCAMQKNILTSIRR